MKDIYCKIKQWIVCTRLKYKLYKQETLDRPTDWDFLYHRCPYNNPNCVGDNYITNNDDSSILLSIIIPLYNSMPYLQTLISMLESQKTRYTYEVLFVDDGSTDGTAQEVLKRIEKLSNFRLISQDNTGIGGARNKGIESALGKYVAFIDHDDEIEMNFIERLLNVALEKDAEIVKCQYGQKVNGILTTTQVSSGFVWGGVYAKKLFYQVRFPVGYWYEDMINPFLLKPQAKVIKNIDDVLYYHNYTGNNASKVIWRNNDYRCLHQVYLCKALVEGYRKLGGADNLFLLKIVLNECGKLGSGRMKRLDVDTKKQAFLACCEIIDSVDYIGKEFGDDYAYRALKDRNFSAWCLLSELA